MKMHKQGGNLDFGIISAQTGHFAFLLVKLRIYRIKQFMAILNLICPWQEKKFWKLSKKYHSHTINQTKTMNQTIG